MIQWHSRLDIALDPGQETVKTGELVKNKPRLKTKPKPAATTNRNRKKPIAKSVTGACTHNSQTTDLSLVESRSATNVSCVQDSDDEYSLACSEIGGPQWLRDELGREALAAFKADVEETDKERIPPKSPPRAEVVKADDLRKSAMEHVQIIKDVSRKSGHLKDTCQRALNEASQALVTIIENLSIRTITDETTRLLAENARLSQKLKLVREKSLAFERAYAERNELSKTMPPASLIKGDALEELKRSITSTIGEMFNDRLNRIEKRLPPVLNVEQPPSIAEKPKKKHKAAESSPPNSVTSMPKAIDVSTAQGELNIETHSQVAPAEQVPDSAVSKEPWTTVVM
ncbi:unnamed protein product [Chilo suppressalis]|uniref:Uncharacterized protein n=1 Tax=Chilo suppressalis TaxID=168631 RepID=A0ABN8AW45_CHISP|nr:unnamed protein product [Chilo suppressalis]